MIDLRKLSATAPQTYPFGMAREPTVVALRQLADRIERKEVRLQGALLLSEAQADDFQFETLLITVARKETP